VFTSAEVLYVSETSPARLYCRPAKYTVPAKAVARVEPESAPTLPMEDTVTVVLLSSDTLFPPLSCTVTTGCWANTVAPTAPDAAV